ncbi:MAG: hypothetical protein QNJ12_04750 [Ilumatobacter sp.]|uniref:hypothetical protein n=1 Tax=Ilumatobacter sp. TaxID=1967498 RepID=UPI002615C730|nr:hypothetical protein [Ilumatobacter sp.]MDJ0768076.1 hypothetical protein [Ilumatobacter sp.]
MPDQHESPIHDRLRSTLAASAEEVVVEPNPSDVVTARAASKRRRRRALVGGGVAATLFAGAGLLIAVTGGEDSAVQIADDETSDETSEDTSDDAGAAAASTGDGADTSATETRDTVPPEAGTDDDAATSSVAEVAPALPASTENAVQLLPWHDGFLSISHEFEPQPLTPLPDEIVALFPPEVQEAFPDGLPPTIQEATEVLGEAGLLDEVSAVLEEHPEASDAIYATPPPPPRLTARFTTDGVDWTTTEIELPLQFGHQFRVAGDRLVAWGVDEPTYDERPGRPDDDGTRTLVIATTTDLVTWSTVEVELAVTPTVDEFVHTDIWVESVALSGDRWLALAQQHTWFDFEQLLPDDIREMMQSRGGGGYSNSSSGIEVEVFDEAGERTTFEFTWEELGLDGNPEPLRFEPDMRLLGGDLGGDHGELPLPDDFGWGTLTTLDDEFVLITDSKMLSSADGSAWTSLPGVPVGSHITSIVPIDNGHLIVGDSLEGPQAWIRAADGSLTEAQLPELPERYGLWNQGSSAAWITEVHDDVIEDWKPVTITVEHEGFVLVQTDGPDGSSYVLTDAATGEVVQSATIDYRDESTQTWEFDEESGTASIVIRDDAGDELVRIPEEVFAEAAEAAYDAIDVPAVEEEWSPDFWLIATTNGVDWLVRDLDDPDPEGEFAIWPQFAAVNGDRILYQTVDGWVFEQL